MATLAAILGLIFLLFVAAGVYVGVKAVRTAKRGIDRTVTQARRTVEDTRLRARQYAQPGVAGELAELRLSLRTSMRATQEALDAAAPGDASLAEASALFARLSAHGHRLDEEMRRLEQEPDKTRLAAFLPELRERTERITHSADSLRWAARDRARHLAADDLADLGRDIDVETGALRHWTAGPGADASGADATWAGSGAAAWDAGATAGDAGDGQAGAGESGSAEGDRGETQRPSIAPPDPARQPPYSWQKSPRPDPWRSSRPENTA